MPAKGEAAAEVDKRVSVSTELRLADDGGVGVDCIGIETNACQKALESGIAVAKVMFAVESCTSFVDQVIADGSNIRDRYRVVANIVLSDTQASIRRVYGRGASYIGLHVVNRVDVISVCEVMI